MTHIENLKTFLRDGFLYAPRYKPQPQYSISFENINNKRGKDFQTSCGKSLHNYVPFYFSTLTTMQYTIAQNNVPLLNPNKENIGSTRISDVIFLVIYYEKLSKMNINYLFSNKACNTGGYKTSKSKDIVNWKLFNESPLKGEIPELNYARTCQYFLNKDESPYEERASKRMAEYLVEDKVPFSIIDAIIVQNKETLEIVKDTIANYTFKGKILLKPGCYYE